MKSLGIILLIFLFWVKGSASDSTVVFSDLSYEEVLNQAKEENKPVFLYFHFDGCGACIQMERSVFNNEKVAEYFNQSFICHSVNTRKGVGIETNKLYNIKLHPTFLFLDSEGNPLHKIVGVFSPDEFTRQAKEAVNGIKSLSIFNQRYEQGDRIPEFLLEYCYILRDANLLDSSIVNEYLSTQSPRELESEENIRFIYEFGVHEFEITTPYRSPAFISMYQNRDKYASYFEADQVETRLAWILTDALEGFLNEMDSVAFFTALRWLDSLSPTEVYLFKEMDGRTTGYMDSRNVVSAYRMAYAEKSGDSVLFEKLMKENVQAIWDDAFALNEWAWRYYLNRSKIEDLERAVLWARRSVELESGYNNNDTYAALLYKLGRYREALERAELAISFAKEQEREYKETVELIKRIKTAMDE